MNHIIKSRFPNSKEEAIERLEYLSKEWADRWSDWEESYTNIKNVFNRKSTEAGLSDILHLLNAYDHLANKYACEKVLSGERK